MLDRRLEQFDDQEQFTLAVLGLVSLADTIERLAGLPAADGAERQGGSLTNLFLGLISAGRTLRGHLAFEEGQPERGGAPTRQVRSGLLR